MGDIFPSLYRPYTGIGFHLGWGGKFLADDIKDLPRAYINLKMIFLLLLLFFDQLKLIICMQRMKNI